MEKKKLSRQAVIIRWCIIAVMLAVVVAAVALYLKVPKEYATMFLGILALLVVNVAVFVYFAFKNHK